MTTTTTSQRNQTTGRYFTMNAAIRTPGNAPEREPERRREAVAAPTDEAQAPDRHQEGAGVHHDRGCMRRVPTPGVISAPRKAVDSDRHGGHIERVGPESGPLACPDSQSRSYPQSWRIPPPGHGRQWTMDGARTRDVLSA